MSLPNHCQTCRRWPLTRWCKYWQSHQPSSCSTSWSRHQPGSSSMPPTSYHWSLPPSATSCWSKWRCRTAARKRSSTHYWRSVLRIRMCRPHIGWSPILAFCLRLFRKPSTPGSPPIYTAVICYRRSNLPTVRITNRDSRSLHSQRHDGVVDEGPIGAFVLLDLSTAFTLLTTPSWLQWLRNGLE